MPNQIEGNWLDMLVPKLTQNHNQKLHEASINSSSQQLGKLLGNCLQQSQSMQNA